MPDPCEAQWRQRCLSSPFCEAVAFRGEDLVLGQDTVLCKLGAGNSGAISLRAGEAAHDRMVALLAVAGRGRLAQAGLAQLAAALGDWRRGDRGLAAIRLAFAPLPRLRDRNDAHRLFLAETALDAGLSPAALLAELGYRACAPLLKFDPNQPRVPAGSGEESGRWTSGGAGGGATASRPASREPAREGAASLRPTPVLFPDGPEDRERTSPAAEWRRLDIGGDTKLRIEESRPVLPQAPGTVVPLPRSQAPNAPARSEATGAGSSSLAIPEPGISPIPRLQAAPNDPDPASSTSSKTDKGVACPDPRNDRPNGANFSGDEFEYRMSLLINPNNPTPKYSMATPNVTSQAYYLPSPAPDGKTSFDDCKKDNTPTVLPIPDLKRGAMFEHKAGGWGWELFNQNSKGFRQFDRQVENQHAAVVLEGRGRQIYYCLNNQTAVDKARDIYRGRYPNSHFLVCH